MTDKGRIAPYLVVTVVGDRRPCSQWAGALISQWTAAAAWKKNLRVKSTTWLKMSCRSDEPDRPPWVTTNTRRHLAMWPELTANLRPPGRSWPSVKLYYLLYVEVLGQSRSFGWQSHAHHTFFIFVHLLNSLSANKCRWYRGGRK